MWCRVQAGRQKLRRPMERQVSRPSAAMKSTWYGGGHLDEDTQSLQNVAYATTGQPERLTN